MELLEELGREIEYGCGLDGWLRALRWTFCLGLLLIKYGRGEDVVPVSVIGESRPYAVVRGMTRRTEVELGTSDKSTRVSMRNFYFLVQ